MNKSLGCTTEDVRTEVAEGHEGIIRTPGVDDTWCIGGIGIVASADQNIIFVDRNTCRGA